MLSYGVLFVMACVGLSSLTGALGFRRFEDSFWGGLGFVLR